MTFNFPFGFSRTTKFAMDRQYRGRESFAIGPMAGHAEPLEPAQPTLSFAATLLAADSAPVKPAAETLSSPVSAPAVQVVKKAGRKPAARQASVLLARGIAWLKKTQRLAAAKKLRVSETVSLGDKRFVAVVHVEGRRYLIGGGTSGVSLLAQLEAAPEGEGVLQSAVETGKLPA